ncbi:MAG: tRNA (adenosine(37)-N6)-threonylcarbamoyltransferase complex transferase subunit TsaD, partial [Rhodobacteraceae bacterium]|nr:tRNA (adenosine(37)-N6)-threonylcarbamoyltransferase complex transferase subunit TsaD [Paracoccaceae bacterium]
GLSVGAGLPLVGVNHLAGHALTARMTDDVVYPFVVLLVSGGHCQLLLVEGPESYTRLGSTIDDAPGEAFDKVARSLSLTQPGGPSIEHEAHSGNADRFQFPRPLLDQPNCNMSFSGLKTAVLRERDRVMDGDALRIGDRADLCASFQKAVADVLAEKSRRALGAAQEAAPITTFAVAGGVAANTEIRDRLEQVASEAGVRFVAPPLKYCTDNAAMIAYAGAELFALGHRDGPTLSARPRWPLDTASQALVGGGRKGPKS